MQFEHLVQVNDPLMPLLDPLTRTQLWTGLVRQAEDPAGFMPALDRCRILERRNNYLKRELTFGRHVFVDHVALLPQERVRYDSDIEGAHAGSHLTVTIEEPGPGLLWVRFQYRTVSHAAGGGDDEQVDGARRAAYKEADIDTIRRIRQLAAAGLI
jgi:hypothetical protein